MHTSVADMVYLGEGGDGGREERTPHIVRKNPGRAGRNQTRLSRGSWEGEETMIGVTNWPRTRPRGLDIARRRVARPRSSWLNQFWLTWELIKV